MHNILWHSKLEGWNIVQRGLPWLGIVHTKCNKEDPSIQDGVKIRVNEVGQECCRGMEEDSDYLGLFHDLPKAGLDLK